MNLKYIQALAILLWGAQTDLLMFAVPMAAILEIQHFLNRRWALTKSDFYRTADLTSVSMVVLIVFLFLNRAEYHFIKTLISWLPILFFPLVVVLSYSTTERMSLDVLFYSLRRQKQPVTQSWDMGYVFFGLCLVAAGVNTRGIGFYSVAVALLVLIALFRLRSQRYSTNLWILSACVLFLFASVTQQGLHLGHMAVKEKTRGWLADFLRDRINPLRTRSAIGSLGRLKLSDAIVLRILVEPGGEAPLLLQEASYDIPSENDWMVIDPQFAVVPHADDFRWRLQDQDQPESRARIYLEFDRASAIIPIPATASEIDDLPATELKQSRFGSIQGTGMVRSAGYDVAFRPRDAGTLSGAADSGDTYIPRQLTPMLDQVLQPYRDSASTPVEVVRRLFRDYRYSLAPGLPVQEEPLTWFLTQSKAGHCEYFASATVLLLRRLGIPARYVVGYSVQEFNSTLGMYIVRQRHAHAWAIAWLTDRWVVIDTTPAIWAEAEADNAGLLRPLWDMAANGTFLLQLWWSQQKLEDYQLELYGIGIILALILAWRIATGEQVRIRQTPAPDAEGPANPGMGSAFFRIEQRLVDSGRHRPPGEPFATWLRRVGYPELLPLLSLHNRLRFDPRGLNQDQVDGLASKVQGWLDVGESRPPASPDPKPPPE